MFFEGGRHADCGGAVEFASDGIRARCWKCGAVETWEQAARRLAAALRVYVDAEGQQMQKSLNWLAQAGKVDEELMDLMTELNEVQAADQGDERETWNDNESLRLLGKIADDEL